MILSTAGARTSYHRSGHSQRIEAEAMNGDKDSGLEADIDTYVSKPVKRQTLFAAIERVLGTD